jgi:hypothetical protein
VAHVPKVVLLGKNSGEESEKTQKILASINPEEIPGEFLYSVFITSTNGTRYQLDKKNLKRGISYKNIDETIRKLKVKGEVDVIEIVIDLGKVQTKLDEQSAEFLNKFFDN